MDDRTRPLRRSMVTEHPLRRLGVLVLATAALVLVLSGTAVAGQDLDGSLAQSNATDGADLQVTSIDHPDVVDPDEDLTVSYTIENTGDVEGTESSIEFWADGLLVQSVSNVTLGPGETASGTFLYDSVSYDLGDTIEFSVELVDFQDSMSGTTDVGTLEESGTVSIRGSVATDSVRVAVRVDSLDVQDGSGFIEVDNLDNDRPSITRLVEEGDIETVSLDLLGGVALDDTIRVRLAAGSDMQEVLDTATTDVVAGDNAPIPSFGWNPGVPEVGQPVAFDAGNSRGDGGDIVEYRWDFTGDGEFDTVSTSPVVQHSFAEAGTREVRLVVENEVGLTAEETNTVTVRAGPAPAEAALSTLLVAGQATPATIQPGPADASVTVANAGEEAGTFEVTLTIGGTVTETLTTQLQGGEERTVTFESATADLDPGTYDISVSTDNDTASGTVTVEQPDPAFEVDIVETNSPVSAGSDLTATVAVENTGDRDATATVAVDWDGLGSETLSVPVAGGESTTETVSVTTADGDAGDYVVTVATGEESATATVTVETGDDTLFTPTLLFVLLLVALVAIGGFYYYVYEPEQSDEGMEPL